VRDALPSVTLLRVTSLAADPIFTPKTLSFLRALKRNNDREWFQANRERYERDVKDRLHALVERLAQDLQGFAPELVAAPRVSLFRINRDTRFSADKSPYKTQMGCVLPHRDLARMEGACLYLEIGPERAMVAGGIYAPQPPELRTIREHLATHYRRFRAINESPVFRRAVGPVEGDTLQRVPHGFPKDHPAAEYLKLRQYLFGRTYPAAFAVGPTYYRDALALMRRMIPMVRFLNEPLLVRRREADPLFVRDVD
jgi:uncharacterized protein (TIGR02453 family)